MTSSGGTLTKTGAGTLTFGGSAANTYTGLTSVTGGTLALDKPGGVVGIAGPLSVGNAINPGAPDSVAVTGNGYRASNYIPLTVYSDGFYSADGFLSSLTMTGGQVDLVGSGTILSGNITTNASANPALISAGGPGSTLDLNGGTQTATVARGTATYDLDIQATLSEGTLVKNGPGVLRLRGQGFANPGVVLNAGTLAVGSSVVERASNLPWPEAP